MSFAFSPIKWLDHHPQFSADVCEVITKVGIKDRPKDEECKKSSKEKKQKQQHTRVEMRCSTTETLDKLGF